MVPESSGLTLLPWHQLRNAENKPISYEDLKPIVLVYLSAKWCPPCQAFGPKLSQLAKDFADDISVVYVGLDRNFEEFEGNLAGKPFNRFEYNSSLQNIAQQIMSRYACAGIPSLLVFEKESGNIITSSGRMAVEATGRSVVELWKQGKPGVDYYEMTKQGIAMVVPNLVAVGLGLMLANVLLTYLKDTFDVNLVEWRCLYE